MGSEAVQAARWRVLAERTQATASTELPASVIEQPGKQILQELSSFQVTAISGDTEPKLAKLLPKS